MAEPTLLEGVPVIDAAGFLAPGQEDSAPAQSVINQVAQASQTWGFFQLINHGVPQELLDEHYDVMTRFFALPLEMKQGAKRSRDNALGYFNDEFTKQKMDLKEGFDFRHVQHPDLPEDHPGNFDPQGTNRWPPQAFPEFREVNERYMREMSRISFRLLEVFALGLGLPSKALHSMFEPSHTSFLRLNYYPLVPGVADGLGISPHKDAGFLTVLVQDSVPGLQVQREGQWYTVQPLPGALTINVGDMAQVFTNDVFYASEHRVLKSERQERYSRAFFFNPSFRAEIVPSPGLALAGHKAPLYRPVNWGEFRRKRYQGDYADVGEEVQIDWYRLDR